MMRETIPYVIVGMLAVALVLLIISLQQLRRGRTGPYWRLRREAGQRGGRLFLISMFLFGLAIALAFFSGFGVLALDNARRMLGGSGATQPVIVVAGDTPTPTPTPMRTPTATDPPTVTALPTITPSSTVTSTNTPTPTATATPSATATPTATYETALNLRSFPDARPAGRSAVVRVIAADTQVSSNNTPVEPVTVFQAGVRRIYFFFSYRGLDDGVAWSRVLFRNGAALQGSSLIWSLGNDGSSYFFFGSDDGYPPGLYRVELKLGDEIASEFNFTVAP